MSAFQTALSGLLSVGASISCYQVRSDQLVPVKVVVELIVGVPGHETIPGGFDRLCGRSPADGIEQVTLDS